MHCVKRVRIRRFSPPYFLAFGLNTEIYSINLRIQSKCRKIRTRKTLNTDTFYAMMPLDFFYLYPLKRSYLWFSDVFKGYRKRPVTWISQFKMLVGKHIIHFVLMFYFLMISWGIGDHPLGFLCHLRTNLKDSYSRYPPGKFWYNPKKKTPKAISKDTQTKIYNNLKVIVMAAQWS